MLIDKNDEIKYFRRSTSSSESIFVIMLPLPGLIMNRFAKDTFNMDEKFPDVFTDFMGLGVFYLGRSW